MTKLVITQSADDRCLGYCNTGSIATANTLFVGNGYQTVAELNAAFLAVFKDNGRQYQCGTCAIHAILEKHGEYLTPDVQNALLSVLNEEPKANPERTGFELERFSDAVRQAVDNYNVQASTQERQALKVTPVKAMEKGTGSHGVPHFRHAKGFGCTSTSGNVSAARQAAAIKAKLDDASNTSIDVVVQQRKVANNTYYTFDVTNKGKLLARHFLHCEVSKPGYYLGLGQLIEQDYDALKEVGAGIVLIISTAFPSRGGALLLRGWIEDSGLDVQVMHLGFPNKDECKWLENLDCQYRLLTWGDKEESRLERMRSRSTFDNSGDTSCRKAEKQTEDGDADEDKETGDKFKPSSHQEKAIQKLEAGAITKADLSLGWLKALPPERLRAIAEERSNETYVLHARRILNKKTEDALGVLTGSAVALISDCTSEISVAIRAATVAEQESLLEYSEATDLLYEFGLEDMMPPRDCWTPYTGAAFEKLIEDIESIIDNCKKEVGVRTGSARAARRVPAVIAKALRRKQSDQLEYLRVDEALRQTINNPTGNGLPGRVERRSYTGGLL